MTPVRRYVAGSLTSGTSNRPSFRVFDKDVDSWVEGEHASYWDAQLAANQLEFGNILTPEQEALWARIESWLTQYYPGDLDLLPCIKSQTENWIYTDARTDKYAGQHEDPGSPQACSDAEAFAISALVECHEGPHLDGCPSHAPDAYDYDDA